MSEEPNALQYRSRDDAVAGDVRTSRRSLRTWGLLCVVWGVGLVVWAGYLAVIAVAVLRLLT
jgi:hypothetical protein